MNRLRMLLFFFATCIGLFGCTKNSLVDTNMDLTDHNWAYTSPIRERFEVKDSNQGYEIYFKLRHTGAYRYSNMYILFRIKGDGFKKSTRYQFKLSKSDGQWLGKGSGDLYTKNFPLLTNYHFPKSGKYEIEIEQNMRDNPLIGISDVGLTVAENSAQ